jgi:hypothetical protein
MNNGVSNLRWLVAGAWMFGLAAPALGGIRGLEDPGGTGYWDLFAVTLSPSGFYWDSVNGGFGGLADPLVQPDPGSHPLGVPVIDPATPLGGTAWGYGGHGFGNGVLEGGGFSDSFTLLGQQQYFLSVTLDTATGPETDLNFPSWGFVELSVNTIMDGVDVGAALPAWFLSPFAPAIEHSVVPGAVTLVHMALLDFGAPEGAIQSQSIWGAGAILPSVLDGNGNPLDDGYRIDILKASVNTWDSYNQIPAPSALAVLGLAALGHRRRRRAG